MTKSLTILLWLPLCLALLAGCGTGPSGSGRPDPGPQYWLSGALAGTPLSGPAVVTVNPGSPAAPIVSATSNTPFVVTAVTSDTAVGVQTLTLMANIIVCTTQGLGVVKPVAFWAIVPGHVPFPPLLNVQFNPNIAGDMGLYDEVDYKITTQSLTPSGKSVTSPPLQYRFVRPGLQPHPCIP